MHAEKAPSAPVKGTGQPDPFNQAEAARLHAAGFKLCKLEHLRKRPEGINWNGAPVSEIDTSASGYGIILAANGLCSIDPDQLELATIALRAVGFDLNEIMGEGVRTTSTRPGSGGRSAFKSNPSLKWFSFAVKLNGSKESTAIFELRAGSPNLQDCCPGVRYQTTRRINGEDVVTNEGAVYGQEYTNGKTFLKVPELPFDLAEFWEHMSNDPAFRREAELKMVEALRAAGHDAEPVFNLRFAGKKLAIEINPLLRAKFNAAVSVEAILAHHGYSAPSRNGGRWAAPGSTGAPSIRLIPGHESLWQSDHQSDPLNGTFDAAQASVVLDHDYNVEAFEEWCRARLQGLKHREAASTFGSEPEHCYIALEADPTAAQEQEAAGPRWNFKPLDMAKVMREEPKPINWLFHQRVPGNRGALLTGLGGTSKTQMLYQMAVAAILGTCPWGWAVDTTGKAVLILTEDDANDPHITIHTIKMAMMLTAEQERMVEENLIVFPLAGEDLKLMIRGPDSGSLIESGRLRGFEEMIKGLGGVAFVGIDPALGVTEGDEASQADQRALGRMADNLAVRCACSVFILTHGTKGSLQSDEITSHSSRGGGAITDAVRAEYGMRTMTVKEAEKYGVTDIAERESYVQLKATKGNRIPPEAKVPVWFRRSRGGYLEVVELVETERGGISPMGQRALDTLIEMDSDNAGVRLQDWRQRCIEKEIIGGPTDEALKKAMGRVMKKIGNRIKKKEGERGIYQRNIASFDPDIDDDIEDAA